MPALLPTNQPQASYPAQVSKNSPSTIDATKRRNAAAWHSEDRRHGQRGTRTLDEESLPGHFPHFPQAPHSWGISRRQRRHQDWPGVTSGMATGPQVPPSHVQRARVQLP